ncbi:hypothetical protein LEP1GSC096_3868 [Leptospira interrogans serovar Hebdomadis str. R499]|nr:hypothetical protein LEP1GSC045_2683 [Leptospira interrogans serovar Pomona str. Kennewicki LC82-25]EKN96156.1 hypothetical protein LEP1GSC014_3179 [Leptospira interrogans serovar Pomona str. Pomona]EKR35841.1 hypothetical protein LEP1GSC096_3868 [Leptospira interrogans serovar Hebdomadis str. R499]EMI63246.1 hypothetical protein LEP1GSC200_3821 [Leptospira interrogans serovar Pomona str. CSL10083]EMJ64347.1 hypothetical protein LEP1GSC197_2814 [Leptospira interrogans serovar Pomona str. CSL
MKITFQNSVLKRQIYLKNLSQNLKMWELTQKFNNIRIT